MLPPANLCLFHYRAVAGAKDLVSRHDASSEIGHNKQPPIKIPYYSGTKRAVRGWDFKERRRQYLNEYFQATVNRVIINLMKAIGL